MKLTTKLLFITLLALSFSTSDPKNIIPTDTCITVASEENPNYEQINKDNTPSSPRSLDTFTIM